ncbi:MULTISPECIES: PD-(D/E)XK nuclease family protein [unclassified Coleofasciculus]|uniref:PD-(D/E)XK nuclease family protein n=1 Tax=unclassified Coleofasciculus TaxID=2692782 RepID=UPI00187E11C2|nr:MULTISPECIES: PD-(D/E)XK nuclease family protein [unclassified Coleofasciculus]MBE9128167.1 PD-(D/E)XK nuclease family protein [Coleofasciculus sp. LEGE 07081]MBE9149732.1 PD-(D/E)XK nuclease family protein [Coleofasciculus sp. LEGE 07092]
MNFKISPSPLIRLSQGQLNIIETCPRKFQHIYFDQLGTPVSPEQQERLTWGSRFHLLMQQRELGLPVESLVEEDAQLRHWVTALVDTAPEVFAKDSQTFRDSEHCRTVKYQGYLLTVIYDLLIEDETSAQILDWKTYPQPQNRHWLAKDWQTRLYLYVLAETSDYLPEQISMSYWFVKSQPCPQSLKFTYDRVQHEKTQQDLTELLSQLTKWLERYQNDHIPFPQLPVSANRCHDCSFAVRCQRTADAEVSRRQKLLSNLADIEEVSL